MGRHTYELVDLYDDSAVLHIGPEAECEEMLEDLLAAHPEWNDEDFDIRRRV